jgi:hypothetical protein
MAMLNNQMVSSYHISCFTFRVTSILRPRHQLGRLLLRDSLSQPQMLVKHGKGWKSLQPNSHLKSLKWENPL